MTIDHNRLNGFNRLTSCNTFFGTYDYSHLLTLCAPLYSSVGQHTTELCTVWCTQLSRAARARVPYARDNCRLVRTATTALYIEVEVVSTQSFITNRAHGRVHARWRCTHNQNTHALTQNMYAHIAASRRFFKQ